MRNLASTIFVVFITASVFILTKNPWTREFSLQMTLVSLLVLIGYLIYLKTKSKRLLDETSFVYFFSVFILFLVASTGWFFSPFFFSLYLLAVIFAFVVSPAASLGFLATLVLLFSVNIGEVDLTYDFLVVLSLLTVMPVTLYLRKEYLRLKEAEKKILVLEKEGATFPSKVEEILANKVNNFAVSLRQPINDVKQLTYRIEKFEGMEEFNKYKERILASVELALRLLKEFEEDVTGKKLLSTPGNSSPLQQAPQGSNQT